MEPDAEILPRSLSSGRTAPARSAVPRGRGHEGDRAAPHVQHQLPVPDIGTGPRQDELIARLERDVPHRDSDFLSGVVQRERRWGVEAWGLWPSRGVEGLLRVPVHDLTDIGHESGRDGSFWVTELGVRVRHDFASH